MFEYITTPGGQVKVTPLSNPARSFFVDSAGQYRSGDQVLYDIWRNGGRVGFIEFQQNGGVPLGTDAPSNPSHAGHSSNPTIHYAQDNPMLIGVALVAAYFLFIKK
jgi:hypothetical protein